MAVVATALTASVAATARAGNLCNELPIANVLRNDLGFRAGWPSGSQPGTRGHAKVNLTTRRVSGVMCQANRGGTSIILSIGHRLLFASHHAVRFGVPGNILTTNVRVTNTTDPNCPIGTHGQLTVFASYNNLHKDSVELSFPVGCRGHQHRYTGPSVTTNVPPN